MRFEKIDEAMVATDLPVTVMRGGRIVRRSAGEMFKKGGPS